MLTRTYARSCTRRVDQVHLSCRAARVHRHQRHSRRYAAARSRARATAHCHKAPCARLTRSGCCRVWRQRSVHVLVHPAERARRHGLLAAVGDGVGDRGAAEPHAQPSVGDARRLDARERLRAGDARHSRHDLRAHDAGQVRLGLVVARATMHRPAAAALYPHCSIAFAFVTARTHSRTHTYYLSTIRQRVSHIYTPTHSATRVASLIEVVGLVAIAVVVVVERRWVGRHSLRSLVAATPRREPRQPSRPSPVPSPRQVATLKPISCRASSTGSRSIPSCRRPSSSRAWSASCSRTSRRRVRHSRPRRSRCCCCCCCSCRCLPLLGTIISSCRGATPRSAAQPGGEPPTRGGAQEARERAAGVAAQVTAPRRDDHSHRRTHPLAHSYTLMQEPPR